MGSEILSQIFSQQTSTVSKKKRSVNYMNFNSTSDLIFYYRPGCNSSKRVLEWLNHTGVQAQKQNIRRICRADIIKILEFSDLGLDDLIKHKTGANSEQRRKINLVDQMTFNEAMDYLQKNTEIIKSPLLIAHNKVLVGYNSDTIRQFIPRGYREALRFY